MQTECRFIEFGVASDDCHTSSETKRLLFESQIGQTNTSALSLLTTKRVHQSIIKKMLMETRKLSVENAHCPLSKYDSEKCKKVDLKRNLWKFKHSNSNATHRNLKSIKKEGKPS